jgi:ParB family chromosome partitioning protein
MGKSRESVANIMRLLKLPRQVQQDMISGRLTMGHGRALLGLKSEQDILFLRKKIVDQSLNVREAEIQVNLLKNKEKKPKKSEKASKDIFIRNLQVELERKLGTKVEIATNKKGGKIAIKYYSNDDLERIIKMFN